MNTETTDNKKIQGWVLYDGDCHLCTGLARRVHPVLEARHFHLLPLQTPWVRERLKMRGPELLEEMRLLQPDGKVFGGADALLEISRHYWFAWPVHLVGKIPFATKFFHSVYRWIARHRHCVNGACVIPTRTIPDRHLEY